MTPTLSASGSPARSEIPPDRVGDAPTSSTASVVGTSAETPLRWEGNTVPGGRAVALRSLFQDAECAGEEHERVCDRRYAQVVDAPYDDPVIAGRMLGDDLALEGGEGVGEQW